eukprot:8672114-Alexandrium_andersonii.AAC.1
MTGITCGDKCGFLRLRRGTALNLCRRLEGNEGEVALAVRRGVINGHIVRDGDLGALGVAHDVPRPYAGDDSSEQWQASVVDQVRPKSGE